MSFPPISFYKFEATGNDFVMADNCKSWFDLTSVQIKRLCHRRFGIGADGLILLEEHPELDFRMRYFNSDGHEGSFCGNGGRAIAAFASLMGIKKEVVHFHAYDGMHSAKVLACGHGRWLVNLGMNDTLVSNRELIDTGSPHHMVVVEDLQHTDVEALGRALRMDARFSPWGCNVNFVMEHEGRLHVRTYERGVEAETLSCGTGVTASAIHHYLDRPDGSYIQKMETHGGELEVHFRKCGQQFTSIRLEGPVTSPFSGVYYL